MLPTGVVKITEEGGWGGRSGPPQCSYCERNTQDTCFSLSSWFPKENTVDISKSEKSDQKFSGVYKKYLEIKAVKQS